MENLLTTSSGWALAADGLQWILQRRYGGQLRAVAFVRSSKDILARCMSEAGVPADTAGELLKDLPPTFNEWAPGAKISCYRRFPPKRVSD
jgi:hypothetical protein